MSGGRFDTTAWTVVLAAGKDDSGIAGRALQALCETYWYPLYSYIRRQGNSPEDATDLTQEFFLQFLEKEWVKDADPGRGRFRSFLLGCVRHFLSNERAKARAQKRGGGQTCLAMDFDTAEQRYQLGPSHALTPENLFDAEWALTILEAVLSRLASEFEVAGKSKIFEHLRPSLLGDGLERSYEELGRELEMTAGAVRVAIHRMRRRYAALLHDTVAETVQNPGDVEAELEYLIQVVRT